MTGILLILTMGALGSPVASSFSDGPPKPLNQSSTVFTDVDKRSANV
jgi:hypothetical protein